MKNKENMKKARKSDKKDSPVVIELNMSATLVTIIGIIILVATIMTAKIITTLVQTSENKKIANVNEENERVYYVTSATKDDNGNIISEVDSNGNVVKIPVPKGYSASQIDGETTASKGFVIYEGDVDWSSIFVNASTESTESTMNTKSTETTGETENLSVENIESTEITESTITTESTNTQGECEEITSLNETTSTAEKDEETTSQEDETIGETQLTAEEQQDKNIFELQKTRNQYVWVPVSDPSRIYGVDSDGKLWGKLYNFSSTGRSNRNWNEKERIISITNKANTREPDILGDFTNSIYDTDIYSYMYDYGLVQNRYEMLSQEIEQNYYEIISSIKKYGGFYIGRYETGGLNGTAVVRKMNTNINNQTWYTMYKKCLTLKGNNDNVKTSMITGNLWDETLEWLIQSGATISDGKTLTYALVGNNSTTWGNYSNATFNYIEEGEEVPKERGTKKANISTRIPTGSAEYTKVNNIYDMSGNVWDWTTEVYSTNSRVCRGGYYNIDGVNNPASNCYGSDSYSSGSSGIRVSFSTLDKIVVSWKTTFLLSHKHINNSISYNV